MPDSSFHSNFMPMEMSSYLGTKPFPLGLGMPVAVNSEALTTVMVRRSRNKQNMVTGQHGTM